MSEERLSLATLGAREAVNLVIGTVTVTAGAAATNTIGVTFDKAFVNAPKIISVNSQETGLLKANLQVTDVTTTGMTIKVYQVLEADVATGDYDVNVVVLGWKAS